MNVPIGRPFAQEFFNTSLSFGFKSLGIGILSTQKLIGDGYGYR